MSARVRHVGSWQLLLVVGGGALVLYFGLPTDIQDIAYEFFGAGSVCAILLGIRRGRPAHRGAWLTIALGITLEVIGDVSFTILDAAGPVPVPSVADVFYLAGPALLALGFARLANPQRPGVWRPALLDAALVATAIGVVGWEFVVGPAIDGMGDPLAVAVTCAYPLLDLVLLAVLARHLLGGGMNNPSVVLLVVGFAMWLASDMASITTSLSGTYVAGTVLDGGWLLGYLLIAAAALHPSMREISGVSDIDGLSRGRIVLVGTALLVPVVALALQPIDGAEDIIVGGLGSAIVVGLVVARLLGSLARTRALLIESNALRAQLAIRATTDVLTGLPNRSAFADAALTSLGTNEDVALVFLDLDGFKRVNDTWGHDAGDTLLREVAARLARVVEPPGMIARMGGDEFAVLLPLTGSPDAARVHAETILAALHGDFDVGDLHIPVHASVGVATGRGVPWSALARDADVAMYEAKRKGGARVEVHERAHETVVSGYRLAHELGRAVDEDELRVWYQPIVDVANDTVAAVEALIRWQHPDRGLLSPASFVPLAESSGSIARLDAWVLRSATQQAARWKTAGLLPSGSQLHVNVSPRTLAEGGYITAVDAALKSSGLAPGELVVEVIETSTLTSTAIADHLRALHERGVELALDDFGSRYAVLGALAALPFDIVKLDRSLLASPNDAAAARLVEGVVRLADGMGVVPIAEGIETRDQIDLIRRIGCTLGQGFLLGRPAAADVTTSFLHELAQSTNRPRLRLIATGR